MRFGDDGNPPAQGAQALHDALQIGGLPSARYPQNQQRLLTAQHGLGALLGRQVPVGGVRGLRGSCAGPRGGRRLDACLLYTSDAADDM
eukprot:2808537-Alexandrium_andersonii.AAC.1